jgi:hypothetical protein
VDRRPGQKELLPVPYVHVVFTLPHHLSHLALVNKKVFYDLLFRASAETLLEVARDPEHLGAQIGFFSVLHSWGRTCCFTLISIVSSRPEGFPLTVRAGSIPAIPSSCRLTYSVASFAASSSTVSSDDFNNAN